MDVHQDVITNRRGPVTSRSATRKLARMFKTLSLPEQQLQVVGTWVPRSSRVIGHRDTRP